MATKRLRRGKSGVRKYGRNLVKCAKYRKEQRREKSHIRSITRHLKHHSNDQQAAERLAELHKLIKK